jgi:hypothetical protein
MQPRPLRGFFRGTSEPVGAQNWGGAGVRGPGMKFPLVRKGREMIVRVSLAWSCLG